MKIVTLDQYHTILETMQYMAIVTMEDEYKLVCHFQISRVCHYPMLNISEMVQDKHMQTVTI